MTFQAGRQECRFGKILLRSAGVGAGFAITLCVVVGVSIWYSDRPKPPKPWNKQAITAEYNNVSTAGDENFFCVQYTLQNNQPQQAGRGALGQ